MRRSKATRVPRPLQIFAGVVLLAVPCIATTPQEAEPDVLAAKREAAQKRYSELVKTYSQMLRDGRKDTADAKRLVQEVFKAKSEYRALLVKEGGEDIPKPVPVPPDPTPTPTPPAGRIAYRARLGAGDHFDSTGVRLTKVGAILQRDRANFYAGCGDGEDVADPMFENSDKRTGIAMRRIVPVGLSEEALQHAVVNHTAIVEVEITPKELHVRLLQPVAAAAAEKILDDWVIAQDWFQMLVDEMPDGVSLRIYTEEADKDGWETVEIRSEHAPDSGFDPQVSPLVGIFRVNADRTKLEHLDRVDGEFESMEEFLRDR